MSPKGKEVWLSLIPLILLMAALFGGIWVYGTFFNGKTGIGQSQPQIPSASASIDYFSWSCQQLQDKVNQELNISFGSEWQNSDTRIWQGNAIALLQIMQLKDCAISP